MAEQEKILSVLRVGETDVQVTRANLYSRRYMGGYAMFNHCYVEKPDGGGGYIFEHDELFDRYVELAVMNDAEITVNIPEASKGVIDSYALYEHDDLPEGDAVLTLEHIQVQPRLIRKEILPEIPEKTIANATLGSEQFAITNRSLKIVRHLGDYSLFDHAAFLDPTGLRAGYIWARDDDGDEFRKYQRLAGMHSAPITRNKTVADTEVIDSFHHQHFGELEVADTIPSEWQ